MKNFFVGLNFCILALGCHRSPMPPNFGTTKLGMTKSQFNGRIFPVLYTGDISRSIADYPVDGLEIEYPRIAEILPSDDIPAALILDNNTSGLVTKKLDYILLQLSKNPKLLSVSQMKEQYPIDFSEGNFRTSNGAIHVVVLQKSKSVIHFIFFRDFVRVSFRGKDAFFKYPK